MKGYRMEKRFIPLHCRSLRFFCKGCEQPFSIGDGEVVSRPKGNILSIESRCGLTLSKDSPSFINCTHCGEEYSTALVQLVISS